jgi:hypothetical protein
LIRGEGFGNCGWIEGKISLEPDYTPLQTAKPALWKGRSNPSFVVVLYLPQALYGVGFFQPVYGSIMMVLTEQD